MTKTGQLKKLKQDFFSGAVSYNGDSRAVGMKQLIKAACKYMDPALLPSIEIGPRTTALDVVLQAHPGCTRLADIKPLCFNTALGIENRTGYSGNFSNLLETLNVNAGRWVGYVEASDKDRIRVGICLTSMADVADSIRSLQPPLEQEHNRKDIRILSAPGPVYYIFADLPYIL